MVNPWLGNWDPVSHAVWQKKKKKRKKRKRKGEREGGRKEGRKIF